MRLVKMQRTLSHAMMFLVEKLELQNQYPFRNSWINLQANFESQVGGVAPRVPLHESPLNLLITPVLG